MQPPAFKEPESVQNLMNAYAQAYSVAQNGNQSQFEDDMNAIKTMLQSVIDDPNISQTYKNECFGAFQPEPNESSSQYIARITKTFINIPWGHPVPMPPKNE